MIRDEVRKKVADIASNLCDPGVECQVPCHQCPAALREADRILAIEGLKVIPDDHIVAPDWVEPLMLLQAKVDLLRTQGIDAGLAVVDRKAELPQGITLRPGIQVGIPLEWRVELRERGWVLEVT